MKLYKELVPMIESNLENMTNTEKEIAYYFLNNLTVEDLSIEKLSKKLHVSKASLTRFSKKCGFSGFREFIFHYKEMQNEKRSF